MSTYNGIKYIDRQLQSIYMQALPLGFRLQLLIRDDKSTDNTVQIIKKWKNKLAITLIAGKENLGPAKSFWHLLKIAPESDFYAFSDQDDIWDKDKLMIAIKYLSTHSAKIPLLYGCQAREKDHEKNEVKKIDQSDHSFNLTSIMINGSFEGCSMVFNDNARIEAIKQDENLIPMHDFALLISTMLTGKVIYDKEPHFTHVIHKNNADTINKNQKKYIRIKKARIKWKNNSNATPINEYIAYIIKNYSTDFLDKDLAFYKLIRDYRESLLNKLKIIFIIFKNRDSSYRDSEISFAIRILFNQI